ncbi:MAG: GNAT family N-acetyltransferase [Thaumarchaeota archaeon]|nr:GNAT family N-acetyltransferase [Nitrososphaerota archaeon]
MGEIIPLDEKNAEELHELLVVSWADTYRGILPDSIINAASTVWHSAETLRRQMKSRVVLFAGYREDGRLLGMVRAAKVEDGIVRIFQLYVLPGNQRKGIGTKLMDYSVAYFPEATRFVLDVSVGNERGISFYEKYGFKFSGVSTLKIEKEEIQNLEGSLER